MKKLLVVGLMLLVALRVAACGGSESTDASPTTDAQATAALEKLIAMPEVAHPEDWGS